MRSSTPSLPKTTQVDLKQEVHRIVNYFVEVFDQLNKLKDQIINQLFTGQAKRGEALQLPNNGQLLTQIIEQLTRQRSQENTKKQRHVQPDGYRSKENGQRADTKKDPPPTRKISEFVVEEPVTHKVLSNQISRPALRAATPQQLRKQQSATNKFIRPRQSEMVGSVVLEDLRNESERLDRQILKESMEIKTHHEPSQSRGSPRQKQISTFLENSLRKLNNNQRR